MKKILPFIICAAFLSVDAFAQFVEEFRSEPNRRPPASLTAQIDGFREILDINDNGSPDIRSSFGDSLFVRDGLTRDIILRWKVEEGESVVMDKFNERPPGTGFEEIKVTFIAGYSLDKSSTKLTLYEISDARKTQVYDDFRFIGIADFDDGGKPEILAYDVANRQTVILGYQNADVNTREPESDEIVRPLGLAYNLDLKFESDMRRHLIGSRNAMEANSKFDMNGDGHPEIVMFVENDQNEILGLEVLNAKSKTKIWSFQFPTSHLTELQSQFHGFFDVNGDGETELLFGKNTVVTLDQEVHTIDPNFELLMIRDIDADGFPDLLGKGLADTTVQVFGKSLSTSIHSINEIEYLNVEIAPNPFSESIKFNVSLAQEAHLTLSIFNSAGAWLVTLFDGKKGAGNHELFWSPESLQSSIWYARLNVDGAVSVLPIIQIN